MPTCQEETCRKAIDWALKAGSNARMPFDRELFDKPGGEYAVWRACEGPGGLRYRKLAAGDTLSPSEHLGTSHYRTCTNPGRFTGGRR